MLISEIFSSIDGESKRAGELATFVRTVGCNLRCKYCDSKYTWEKDSTSKQMTVQEIVDRCNELGLQNITFTGGEPLLQKDADELIMTLANEGFNVSIETNGAVDFTTREWFINNTPNVWICADYKMPFSGATDKMLPLSTFAKLRPQDVLKMVVAESDLPTALEVIKGVRNGGSECQFYLSPVFNEIEPKKIVEFMQKHRLQYKTRVQLQLHKFIWNPDKRGV